VLDNVTLAIDGNELVGEIGRNGAAKSTLLRLVAGDILADDGEQRAQAAVHVAKAAQAVQHDIEGSVFDAAAGTRGGPGGALARFHHLTHHLDEPGNAAEMARVQALIEGAHGWDLDRRVSLVLQRLELPEDLEFAALSGGMKRRVLLARAL